VKYLNQGADSVIRARRNDAYKKMWRACRGSYEIVSEGPRNEADPLVVVGTYWYIYFKCVRR